MPFDGLTLTKTFAEALQDAGFKPIDNAVLEAHKRAQERRYPGSWGYHHLEFLRRAVAAAAFFLMFAALISGAMATVGSLAYLLAFDNSLLRNILAVGGMTFSASMLLFILLVQAESVKFKRPAAWIEHTLSLKQMQVRKASAPARVRDLIDTILAQHQHRALHFIYGELKQGTAVLDPYFCVIDLRTGEHIVLAIWDDDTILHIA